MSSPSVGSIATLVAGLYSLAGYNKMIADDIRTGAYVRAMEATIRPGDVVVDIGTGTGFFAVLAAKLGAARVYALEPAPVINIARQVARVNDVADRIEFVEGQSQDLELEGGADVVVSDLRDLIPLFMRHIPSIVDARGRLLKPGGTLIPQFDTVWAAPIETHDTYHRIVEPPADNAYRISLEPTRQYLVNRFHRVRSRPEQLLAQPTCWMELDYATITEANVEQSFSWIMERTGLLHGICGWFDSRLAEGVEFSNAPWSPPLIYGHIFFPLETPLSVRKSDRVDARISARLVGDNYVFSWQAVRRTGDGSVEVETKQHSTFYSIPLTRVMLKDRDVDPAP